MSDNPAVPPDNAAVPVQATAVPVQALPALSTHKDKVGRMPKETRDRINRMLDDGLSYADIIARLGPEGQDLTESNLSRWKAGGYQDWLRQQASLEALRLNQEFLLDLLHDQDPTRVNAVGLQLAATRLSHVLLEIEPRLLMLGLNEQPEQYCALINAFVRLTNAAVKCDQHRAEMVDREAKKNPPPRKQAISEESLRQAEELLHLL